MIGLLIMCLLVFAGFVAKRGSLPYFDLTGVSQRTCKESGRFTSPLVRRFTGQRPKRVAASMKRARNPRPIKWFSSLQLNM